MTTVLVTGGAGFIGSQLAERLLAEGHRVVSVDDLSTGRIANLVEARGYGKEFSFFNMDVRADGLASLFERHRPEVVFHLAAQAGVRPSLEDPVHDASVNIMGLLNVLEAAVHIGARKVIYAASGGTMYGEPRRLPDEGDPPRRAPVRSPLRRVEEGRARLPLVLPAVPGAGLHGPRARRTSTGRDRIRPARRVSSRSSPRRCSRARRPTIFGDGNQTRDFVFIDDTVHAFVQAMDRGSGKLVNIGTGLETSVNHLYRLLAELTGFAGEPEHGPQPAGGAAADGPGHLGGALRDRVEAVDPPRGRAGRDGRLPQGHLSSAPSRGRHGVDPSALSRLSC